MKDNKIDIIQQKLGMVRELCSQLDDNPDDDLRHELIQTVKSGAELLMRDLEELRKCTIDNPDYKFSDSHGFTEAKSDAFRNE